MPRGAFSQQECCDPTLAGLEGASAELCCCPCSLSTFPWGTAKPLTPPCSPGATACLPPCGHTVPGRQLQALGCTVPPLSGLALTPGKTKHFLSTKWVLSSHYISKQNHTTVEETHLCKTQIYLRNTQMKIPCSSITEFWVNFQKWQNVAYVGGKTNVLRYPAGSAACLLQHIKRHFGKCLYMLCIKTIVKMD